MQYEYNGWSYYSNNGYFTERKCGADTLFTCCNIVYILIGL